MQLLLIIYYILQQDLIKKWAKLFVELFKEYSRSGLQLMKLHNWCYHIIPTISEFNAINGSTTETYKYLHKSAVKNPYHSSNKRQATTQIIQTVKYFYYIIDDDFYACHKCLQFTIYNYQVKRNAIIKYSTSKKTSNSENQRKKPIMNGLIATFLLSEFEQFTALYKQTNNDLAPEALLAFEEFLSTLNKLFDLCEDLTEEMVEGNAIIQQYSYTTGASSGDCIRAKSKHYYNAEFSNISVNMNEEEVDDYHTDQGICFGKVLMLVNIEVKGYHSIFDVALVQWYDFHYDNENTLQKP